MKRMGMALGLVMMLGAALTAQALTPEMSWFSERAVSQSQMAIDISQTSDGGCIVVVVDSTASGETDIVLTKYDASGNEDWTTTTDIDISDFPRGIDEINTGGYVVVGHTDNVLGDKYPFFLLYDASGTLTFEDLGVYNGDIIGASALTDVFSHNDGTFTICGMHDSATTGTNGYAANVTATATATLNWASEYDGNGFDDGFKALRYDAGGTTLLTGFTDSTATGDRYMFCVSVDGSGVENWRASFGSGDEVEGHGLDFTAAGDIFFAGNTQTAGETDFYVVKTDWSGNLVWEYTYDSGEAEDFLYDAVLWDGYVVLAGEFADAEDLYGVVGIDYDGNFMWNSTASDLKFSTCLATDGSHFYVGGASGGAANQDDAFAARLEETALASLSIIPDPLNPEVAAAGGTVTFTATLLNNYGPYTTNARLRVEHPASGGSWITNTWSGITLPAGTNSWTLNLTVPAGAPVGEYLVYGEIYNVPWNILLYDVFSFEKTATMANGAGSGAVEWTVDGQIGELAGDAQDVVAPAAQPLDYALGAAYPNPFNPSTSVNVQLPETAELTVTVYDRIGRQVTELAHGSYSAGAHTLTFDARGLASGVYFIQASVPGQLNAMQKVVLMK